MARIDSAGAIRKSESTERRAKINEYLILLVLFFFVAVYLVQYWRISQASKIDSIRVENVRVLTPTDLCPGDPLHIAFDLDVQGFGLVFWDNTVKHANHSIMFSLPRRLLVEGPSVAHLIDEWHVPPQPDLPVDEERAWLPGPYVRLVTVSASNSFVSRFVEPQRFYVPFTIRSNCRS